MNAFKIKLLQRLRQFQIESQTLPMDDAPVYRKVLAFIYKLLGRKAIVKSLVCSEKCNGCNLCVKVCPNKALRIRLKNPRRNRRCKGCMVCVYACPEKAFELPFSCLAGAFLLIFLPYDNWIIKLFSLHIVQDFMSVKYQIISFLLWCLGYAVAVFIWEKVVFLLSTLPFMKKFGEIPFIKEIRKIIHPAKIFPIIINNNFEKDK
jgi:ferredoxin